MKDKQHVTMDFSVGSHPIKPDTIVITIQGTGIKATDAKHQHFMEILMKVMATQMYALAHGIEPENIVHTYTEDITPNKP